jgi:cobalt/nickel transport system ATP-binding protein
MIELRGVTCVYPGSVTALDRVSVGFSRGHKTVVMGRNGSGKTTLLSLLNGIARPDGGSVRFAGAPLKYGKAEQRELRRTVGMVFQDADSQVFSASVREDVSFGPVNLGLGVAEVRERVDRALHDMGIADLADRPVHALSHGQKKRVGLAGVLAMRPAVLVLDEPFSGLDHVITSDLVAILSKMHAEGMTLILAMHDVDFAYEWADDVVVLDEGRLIATGDAGDVLGRHEVHAALGCAPYALEVARAAGIEDEGRLRRRDAVLAGLSSRRGADGFDGA